MQPFFIKDSVLRQWGISDDHVLPDVLARAKEPLDNMLPSLPVKKSVLSKLGIGGHELARLKHRLLFPPSKSHTPSQESNICANSDFTKQVGSDPTRAEPPIVFDVERFWDHLQDTIAESSRPDSIQTFRSLHYLDQIALTCLAAGCHDCRAPDCLQYREKLESVVPVCQSWPGLRDWVLCITSCSLRKIRDINLSQQKSSEDLGDEEYNLGLSLQWENWDKGLLARFKLHISACILLTHMTSYLEFWDIGGRTLEVDNFSETDESRLSGSIGQPLSSAIDTLLRPPRVRRSSMYTQTFDPLREGTHAAGPSVDAAEVFHMVMWFRNISRVLIGNLSDAPFWYHHNFVPIASDAIEEAFRKLKVLGFCQKRVLEVVRYGYDGEVDLVPLVRALEHLPQLRHKGHVSCTPRFCGEAIKNFTSVDQLHKCVDSSKCGTTDGKMFDQRLLVAALHDNTATTAWTFDGMSLVPRGMSYLAVSHVWSDGTGAGAWKAGEVNECLWEFWVGIAKEGIAKTGIAKTGIAKEGRECVGIWWDTVCIPREKTARSNALNKMHQNYEDAEYTVVHDLYLAGIEWKNDGSPCIALALSPWFSRGWTALELRLSKKVLILFRQYNGYILKDLNQVLAQHRFLQSHAHWIATDAVEKVEHAAQRVQDASSLLSIIRARCTSWSQDQSIIAGLMCGLTDHSGLPEQEITKRIMLKLGEIERSFLLHGLPTISEPEFSWCPPRFPDIPCVPSPTHFIGVSSEGILKARWEIWCISKSDVDKGTIRPMSADMDVRSHVQRALQKVEGCVILTWELFDAQGLLVRLKVDKYCTRETPLYCEYIGAVYVTPSEIRKNRKKACREVNIGYRSGMVDVGVVDWDHELFLDCITWWKNT